MVRPSVQVLRLGFQKAHQPAREHIPDETVHCPTSTPAGLRGACRRRTDNPRGRPPRVSTDLKWWEELLCPRKGLHPLVTPGSVRGTEKPLFFKINTSVYHLERPQCPESWPRHAGSGQGNCGQRAAPSRPAGCSPGGAHPTSRGPTGGAGDTVPNPRRHSEDASNAPAHGQPPQTCSHTH